jgi:hypothetical protein
MVFGWWKEGLGRAGRAGRAGRGTYGVVYHSLHRNEDL